MAGYGAWLCWLVVGGPLLHRVVPGALLWLAPVLLVAALANLLAPRDAPSRWVLFGLDVLALTTAGLVGRGVFDPALLFWPCLLVLQATRPDRRALVGSYAAAAGSVMLLAFRDGAPWDGAIRAVALGCSSGLLWVTLRRGRALSVQLGARTREVDHLASTFSRYFAPQVAELLAQHGQGALATGRRPITVLFADLSGFTRFTELNPTDLVAETLSEYLDELSRVAMRHDGTIDKFMGDELMVVWNAPGEQPDHARRGLACARDMLLVVDLLNQERGGRGLPVLGLSIGVNTGEVVAGHFGNSERFQYTVIGDAVNVAKRLQGLAGVGELVVGSETLAGAGEPGRPVEELTVKGRGGTVRAARLGGGRSAA